MLGILLPTLGLVCISEDGLEDIFYEVVAVTHFENPCSPSNII
jgi:hypothetical protein